MLPLAPPVKGGSIKELRKLLNVEDNEAILLEAWLLGTLSSTPFPILTLEGEQGTAKSTTTRLLRQLVDPSTAAIRAAPRKEEDLSIAAKNSHVVALDNLSGVPPWLSDALCRVATGGSFATRKHYTNDEEALFTFMRPIILNGIDQIAERHDLADRSLRVTLPVIPPDKRRTEAQLNVDFAEAAPSILAGLCDGVACALKNRSSVQVENLPRMADFTLWCMAAEEAMPWEPGEFMHTYRRNQDESVERALDADLVGNPIMKLMERHDEWEGSPTELLKELEDIVGENVTRLKKWPKTPSAFGKELTRTVEFLRRSGVMFSREKSGNRTITITKASNKPEISPDITVTTGQFFA